MKRKTNQTYVSGKRKTAIARASIKKGSGIVKVNKQSINFFSSEFFRMKAKEPLIIAEDIVKKYDISIDVKGGGPSSQADAIRLVIAKALVEISGDKQLQQTFLDYDRSLLVADVRQREPSKPGRHGKARAKRQKSYR